ncbi:SGNH/GDSL hydrolase family protein [Hymenobacter sp. HDW8]|uniref:SGNH/GDSL hydrolase family protein n=1 Tax=Hymenobacter sp. HDW8 TaxID=2714932 RepID=UPI00140D4940|nr:SGNH/GDSL hydrolase family protein [Hymenobacter sp. HDW8]QIL77676.1 SGNH/GDSL hydrolase family protein [Hymenobacter sp. HDW8]
MSIKITTRSFLLALSISLFGCSSSSSDADPEPTPAPAPAPAPAAPITYKITYAGNSLLSGYLGFVIDSKIMTEVKTQGGAALGAGTSENFAVANYVTPQVLDQMPKINAAFDPTKDVNVLVLWEGTNHIYYGSTAKQAEESLLEVCRRARAAHPEWKIVMGSLLPRSEDDYPATQERDRLAVNVALRAVKASGNTLFHELADVAQDPRIGPGGTEKDKTYYHDLVHLNDAGQAVVAPIFAKSIVAVIKAGK